MPIAGAVGAGFKEPLVHAQGNGIVSQVRYKYRNGIGMMPSAEFRVFHDDFEGTVATNVPAGWAAAIIDTGGTVVGSSVGGTGAIAFNSDDASEGAAIYMPETVILTAGKKFFMEVRVRCDDVTDNAFQFGLSDLTATTNPEDLWTTAAASLVTYGILDGSAAPKMLADLSNTGTSAQTADDTSKVMVVDTWHILAIGYDGVKLRGYVDGQPALLWTGVVPVGVTLAPFIGHLNGNGAGNNTSIVDYIRFAQER